MKQTTLLSFLLILFCLTITTRPVDAHGGGTLQVMNTPVGSYTVSVWTSPVIPRSNAALHVTVGVAGADQAPVLDAHVQVTLMDATTGNSVRQATATQERSRNRLFYEADVPAVAAGDYVVAIMVRGTEGSGSVNFPLAVRSGAYVPWLRAGMVGVVVLATAVLFRLWGSQADMRTRQHPASSRNRRPNVDH